MKQPNSDDHGLARTDDAALERALARLPRVDLSAWDAHAQKLKALRRLQRGVSRAGWLEHREPALLIALAAAHMVWALARVVEIAVR